MPGNQYGESSRAGQGPASGSNAQQKGKKSACNSNKTKLKCYAFMYRDYQADGKDQEHGEKWQKQLDNYASWHWGPTHYEIKNQGTLKTTLDDGTERWQAQYQVIGYHCDNKHHCQPGPSWKSLLPDPKKDEAIQLWETFNDQIRSTVVYTTEKTPKTPYNQDPPIWLDHRNRRASN